MEAKLERLAGAITDLARVVATLQATTRPIEQDPIKQ
jgi:hypothetical protein